MSVSIASMASLVLGDRKGKYHRNGIKKFFDHQFEFNRAVTATDRDHFAYAILYY
jgi:hypothetical protein